MKINQLGSADLHARSQRRIVRAVAAVAVVGALAVASAPAASAVAQVSGGSTSTAVNGLKK